MDDVFKLFSEMIVDIQGFDETNFGIFHRDEREELTRMWNREAMRDPNKFISLLSPAQKKLVAVWATGRTSYNAVRLIETLENFIKYLKTLDSPVYPAKNGDKKTALKGWKKVIYKKR